MATHNFFHWLLTALGTILKNFPLIGLGVVVGLFGFLVFNTAEQPYPLIFGLPLILLGLSITLINIYETLAAVLDRRYNQSHCPICNP